MFEEEIERGVAVLDEFKPQWYHHVDLDRLNLNDCYRCVLGQLFGDFEDGTQDLRRLVGWTGGDGWSFAEHYGFSAGMLTPDAEELNGANWAGYRTDMDRTYDTLTKEWVAKIIEIRQTRRHGKEK